MRSWVVKTGLTLVMFITAVLAGCGGGSSSTNTNTATTVAQVLVTCSPACTSGTLSLVSGQVATLTASANNPSGGNIGTAVFTFNSANPNLATIGFNGGSALVCAGVWDSITVVCNGNDKNNNPLTGTTNVTVSSGGVSSAPIQVSIHVPVNSIVVLPPSSPPLCSSIKETQQFSAHACTTAGTPDSGPPCGPNGRDVTSQVGTFNWSQTNATVASVDAATGLVTANSPGLSGIFASLGSVSSPATNFRSCLPVQIRLHVQGATDTSATLTPASTSTTTDTATLEVDITDEKGTVTNSAPIAQTSNNTQVATISGLTLTGNTPGGAGILASCVPPNCGAGLNLPIYSNLFSTTVSGTSPSTFVYATSSFAPPSGTSPTMIPIDTSKNPPAAQTAITLPGVPNSLVFAANGSVAFMGTSAGLASLTPASNTVALLSPVLGKVLAVSPDGTTVIVSNAALDPGTGQPIEPIGPNQRLTIFNNAGVVQQSFVFQGARAAAFTSDGFKAFIAADCSHNTTPFTTCPDGSSSKNGNVYVFSPQLSIQSINVGGTIGSATNTVANNIDVATLPSGSYALIANVASPNPTGLMPIATCNNAPPALPPAAIATNSANIQMLGATQNTDLIVAVDSPPPPVAVPAGVDIITATVGPITATPPLTPANCAPPISFSNQFVDFGQGAFTAHQLIVSSNGTGATNGSHILVLPAGVPKLFVAVAGSPGGSLVTLAGSATEALSGGLTLDGNTGWVGVGGSNSVDEISLTSVSDILQIPTKFTTVVNGATVAAAPNLVAVQPK